MQQALWVSSMRHRAASCAIGGASCLWGCTVRPVGKPAAVFQSIDNDRNATNRPASNPRGACATRAGLGYTTIPADAGTTSRLEAVSAPGLQQVHHVDQLWDLIDREALRAPLGSLIRVMWFLPPPWPPFAFVILTRHWNCSTRLATCYRRQSHPGNGAPSADGAWRLFRSDRGR